VLDERQHLPPLDLAEPCRRVGVVRPTSRCRRPWQTSDVETAWRRSCVASTSSWRRALQRALLGRHRRQKRHRARRRTASSWPCLICPEEQSPECQMARASRTGRDRTGQVGRGHCRGSDPSLRAPTNCAIRNTPGGGSWFLGCRTSRRSRPRRCSGDIPCVMRR